MSSAAPAHGGSIFRHMVRGSFWALVMRWAVRGVGLVSTLILARLLTPQDFGIVAMGTLVMGFIRTFSALGASNYLIRSRDAPPELCDTVWTIEILQCCFVGVLLAASAPLAVRFFHEPRLTAVFYALAGIAVIDGFQNIGMVLVLKELDYAKDFRFMVYKRLIKFCVVVLLAFIMRSYWAIIIGMAISTVLAIPLSFAMHSYRPRLSLTSATEVIVFGFAMLITSVGRFLSEKVDVLLVGHLASTATMGVYNVAKELGGMATSEVIMPIGRGLLPAYSKVADDWELLKQAYLRSFGVIVLICLPLGVGLSAISADAVRVLLGEQWLGASSILGWLAIYALLNTVIQASVSQILVVLKREWLLAALRWLRVVTLVPAVVIAGVFWGVHAIPAAATVSAGLVLPLVIYKVCRALGVGIMEMAECLWRPVVSALVMALAVHELSPLIGNLYPRFFLEIVVGAVAYVASLCLCWQLSGRPDGIEALSYHAVVGKARALSAARSS